MDDLEDEELMISDAWRYFPARVGRHYRQEIANMLLWFIFLGRDYYSFATTNQRGVTNPFLLNGSAAAAETVVDVVTWKYCPTETGVRGILFSRFRKGPWAPKIISLISIARDFLECSHVHTAQCLIRLLNYDVLFDTIGFERTRGISQVQQLGIVWEEVTWIGFIAAPILA